MIHNAKELINEILVVAKQRQELLEKLKQAIVNDEFQNIRLYAAKLCGIGHESRTDKILTLFDEREKLVARIAQIDQALKAETAPEPADAEHAKSSETVDCSRTAHKSGPDANCALRLTDWMHL